VGAGFDHIAGDGNEGESLSNGQAGSSCFGGFACEPSEAGAQTLVPGVKPIGQRDRLSILAQAPLLATKPQRPIDFGLFDLNARNQLDLFAKRPTTEQQS